MYTCRYVHRGQAGKHGLTGGRDSLVTECSMSWYSWYSGSISDRASSGSPYLCTLTGVSYSDCRFTGQRYGLALPSTGELALIEDLVIVIFDLGTE